MMVCEWVIIVRSLHAKYGFEALHTDYTHVRYIIFEEEPNVVIYYYSAHISRKR